MTDHMTRPDGSMGIASDGGAAAPAEFHGRWADPRATTPEGAPDGPGIAWWTDDDGNIVSMDPTTRGIWHDPEIIMDRPAGHVDPGSHLEPCTDDRRVFGYVLQDGGRFGGYVGDRRYVYRDGGGDDGHGPDGPRDRAGHPVCGPGGPDVVGGGIPVDAAHVRTVMAPSRLCGDPGGTWGG